MAFELNINQLKAFYLTAKLGSVTRAAEKLFVTQPAVSMQLKALEDNCALKLLDIRKGKVQLTEAGQKLFLHAVNIFNEVIKAENMLLNLRDISDHTLRIGSTKTLTRYLLPPYITSLQKRFPDLQIRIGEGSSVEMMKSVLEEQNELAIVGRLTYPASVKSIAFRTDDLLLLAPTSHHLCKKTSVSFSDLSEEVLILRERGSGTRVLTEKLFERSNIIMRACIETGNVDFIKEVVQKNNALTVLARMGVREELEQKQLKILPLEGGCPKLNIDIVYPKDRPLSEAGKNFVRALVGDDSLEL